MEIAEAVGLCKVIVRELIPHLQAGQQPAVYKVLGEPSAEDSEPEPSLFNRKLKGKDILNISDEAGRLELDDIFSPLHGNGAPLSASSIMKGAAECWAAAQTAATTKFEQMSESEKRPETRAQLQLHEFCQRLQTSR